jgi:bacillithiol biosynthesis deacetylase BshB1
MADLLVFAPHPDDAEICVGGTIAAHVRAGASVVVVDATAGELGSRGSAAERASEAAAAARVLGLSARENLGLPDGGVLGEDLSARALVMDAIRRHRPRAVLSIDEAARHPDHLALARLVRPAVKAAALHRLPSPSGAPAWGGARLWTYEAELPLPRPAFLIPLTEADWQAKRAAIACYGSQLHRPGAELPETSIAQPGFLAAIEARARAWGALAGAPCAEAFAGPELPRIADLRAI